MTIDEKQKAKDKCIEVRQWGGDLEDCASLAGISVDTLSNWRKEDTDFSEDLQAAWVNYKLSLIRSVKVDKPDYLLERDFRKRFHLPKEEQTGNTFNLTIMGDDALAKYLYGFIKELNVRSDPGEGQADATGGEGSSLTENSK